MPEQEISTQDKWDKKLELILDELLKCQEDMKVKSCMVCDKTFDCDLRKRYVLSVYQSMSKGDTGGFEF